MTVVPPRASTAGRRTRGHRGRACAGRDRAAARRGPRPRQALPDPRRRPAAADRPGPGRRRRQLRDPARRDARPGRRIGLRQDDRRAAAPAPDRADVGLDPRSTAPTDEAQGRRAQALPPPDADHLPGPVRSPRPAHADRRQHRRGAAHPRPRDADASGARQGQEDDGPGRAAALPRPALSARVLGRPAPAHRDRPGARRSSRTSSSATSRCRRSTSRSRPRSSTCSSSSSASSGLTYVFVAHNMGVVEHISDRVAVMYLGRIAELADRRELFREAGASLHRGAHVGHPDPQPGAPPPAGHPQGRRPEPGQPAVRLPLPPALPAPPAARLAGDLRRRSCRRSSSSAAAICAPATSASRRTRRPRRSPRPARPRPPRNPVPV